MSGLEMFDFHGKEVRVVIGEDSLPRFVAADVASVLEYAGGARNAISRLPERMKGVAPVNTLGGQQKMIVLTEAGVNRLIIKAETEKAEEVQDWLAEEVMPKILRTGSYSLPAQRQSSEVALPTARDLALMVIEAEDAKAALAAQVAVLEPAAAMWNEVATAEGSVLVGDAAKMLQNAGIDTGPVRLFKQMEALGWVYRWSSPDDEAHSAWRAKQDQIACGRLVEVPTTFFNRKAEARQVGDPQIRVTMKGVEKLHDLMGRKRLALPAK